MNSLTDLPAIETLPGFEKLIFTMFLIAFLVVRINIVIDKFARHQTVEGASPPHAEAVMRLVEKRGQIEIWHDTQSGELYVYVYGVMASGDPRIVPSLAMACAIAA